MDIALCYKIINQLKHNSFDALLAIILLSLIWSFSLSSARAELVYLLDSEPVIQFSSRNARWLQLPKLSFDRRSLRCLDEETGEPVKVSSEQKFEVILGFHVDEQGKITKTYIEKSSGNKCFDRRAARQVQTGRLMPFLFKGKAVRGRVSLPITFEYRAY